MSDSEAAEPKLDMLGQITIPLEDQNYVLRPSYAAISAIERSLGRSLTQLAGEAVGGRLSIDDMGVISAEMMKAHAKACPEDPLFTTYRGAKADTIASLIYDRGAPGINARIAVVLMGAITGGYTASGEAKAAGK